MQQSEHEQEKICIFFYTYFLALYRRGYLVTTSSKGAVYLSLLLLIIIIMYICIYVYDIREENKNKVQVTFLEWKPESEKLTRGYIYTYIHIILRERPVGVLSKI